MELELGGRVAVVDPVAVLTASIAEVEVVNYRDCNLGRDVLSACSRYILNFRDVAFLLR
jgi:hypothetical protein